MERVSKSDIEVKAIALNTMDLDEITDSARTQEGADESKKTLFGDNTDSSYGSVTPTVFINGYHVSPYMNAFVIEMNGFLPVLKMSFVARDTVFISANYPKDGDVVSVYIRSILEYKPLRMDFNILNVSSEITSRMDPKGIDSIGKSSNLRFNILAECRIPGLYTHRSKSFSGANSYETLLEISQDLSLGFAANDSSPIDTMSWLCPNYSYYDFIREVTESAFKNENSFYMSFVDCYYNLNFVNLGNQFSFLKDPKHTALVSLGSKNVLVDSKIPGGSNPEAQEYPLLVSNRYKAGEFPFGINGYILISNSGQKANATGYITKVIFYDEGVDTQNPLEKLVNYDVESDTPDSIEESMFLQKGRMKEDIYRQEKRVEWMGVLNEYSTDNPGVHPNYFHAQHQNRMNIEDVTKFTLRVELGSYYPGIYRGQVLPIEILVISNTDTRKDNSGSLQDLKSPEKDVNPVDEFLSGIYVVMGIEIVWDLRGMKQILNLCRRVWKINTSGIAQKYSPLPKVGSE
jgi:hypothetical protein